MGLCKCFKVSCESFEEFSFFDKGFCEDFLCFCVVVVCVKNVEESDVFEFFEEVDREGMVFFFVG